MIDVILTILILIFAIMFGIVVAALGISLVTFVAGWWKYVKLYNDETHWRKW